MGIGGLGIAFRGGSQQNTEHELLLNDLNYDSGTGITATVGSIAWCENYAIAKALASSWMAVRTFKNQFFPTTMGVSIPEWEQTLGIIPPTGATISSRQLAIAQKFNLLTEPPTKQQITDILNGLLSGIFIDVEFLPITLNLGSLPGGVTIPGGVTLPSGNWLAPLYNVAIRIWQPRDKFNNLLMPNPQFNSLYRMFYSTLVNYLPAYSLFHPLQYQYQIAGTISASATSNTITGAGTTFTTQLAVGKTIEVVDDLGVLQTYTIATIINNTSLTIVGTTVNSLTGCFARKIGFFLDFAKNLDNWQLDYSKP